MYLGIDLGTSGVKAIVVDSDQAVRATFTTPLTVSRPRPLWSEQDPAEWWSATDAAVRAVLSNLDGHAVEAVGLSGQMHGATLLADDHTVLRPAILWNDRRSDGACRQLTAREPRLPAITAS
ncbi:MAG: FGGY family carbohydrate kinase, partial [Acidobacteria bacterium]|nr:FGGY family carbohydrate kinase [Acidobacteriota bacterium]